MKIDIDKNTLPWVFLFKVIYKKIYFENFCNNFVLKPNA